MGAGLDLIANNLEISLEVGIAILILLGGFIFYARDFKLGVVLHFLAFGVNFLCFWSLNEYYAKDLNTFYALAFMLLFMIIMSFTLFTISKNEPEGRFT